MDYVERLIRRALAEPREAVLGIFDPFEQVAPWALQQAAGDAALAPTATAPKAAAAALQPVPPAASATVESVPAVALCRAEAAPPALADPLQPAVPAPEVPRPPVADDSASRRPPPEPTPEPASLARADAFMRTLSVKAALPDLPDKRPAAETPAVAPPPPSQRPEPQRPGETVHRLPVLVRPLPPQPLAMPAPPPAPRGARPAEAARDGASPPTARRASAAPPPERIVHTTVLIAQPARRLDDLAHSSGISRFGIGQG